LEKNHFPKRNNCASRKKKRKGGGKSERGGVEKNPSANSRLKQKKIEIRESKDIDHKVPSQKFEERGGKGRAQKGVLIEYTGKGTKTRDVKGYA